ncbi:MarR family winged helix-turn-helix transcriptional regulator [Lacticigenium naphthae]|uniref:MarR family winged helix-turn-helix transcriptional regulator n=1 Tax=Lacticigenium naphthae TaxID=515351 RepID=UPI000423A7E9|nr:MarR family transcriptional regulator [Lacticigenium naphthae]
MTIEGLKLDNQVCFPLYAATREITKRYRPILKELGVTYPQYLVLMVLWESGQLSVKEMGARLHLDSGTLTPMLKRMEQQKLVDRRRSGEDERVVVVELTAKGKEAETVAECIPEQILAQTNLTEAEMVELRRLLNKMLEPMDETE